MQGAAVTKLVAQHVKTKQSRVISSGPLPMTIIISNGLATSAVALLGLS
jgi:hypothetical protein